MIEEGHDLFLSGIVKNILDEDSDESARVAMAGPVLAWRKHKEDNISKLILTTELEDVEIEYHIDLDDLNYIYRSTIEKKLSLANQ